LNLLFIINSLRKAEFNGQHWLTSQYRCHREYGGPGAFVTSYSGSKNRNPFGHSGSYLFGM